jgi:glycolate oxidase iron-sulfur subunit
MRALESGRLPDDDPTLAEESSFCLGCRACEPVCPAGVQYGALLEEWRSHQWRYRPLVLRLLLLAVARPWRVRLLGLSRRHARERDPRFVRSARWPYITRARPEGPSLMLGCFERALFPRVSRSAVRVSPVLGCPARQGCCGALHAHNGDLERGRAMARALGQALPGPIVTTSGGCAAHLAATLGPDRVYEFSAWLRSTSDLSLYRKLMVGCRTARVALQDSCHLRNGLGVAAEPREILKAVAEYVELPSAGSCCGAAGTYSLLRRDDARRVFAPKLKEIENAGVDFVVAVNPGCLRQLQTELRRAKSRVRAIHFAELVDLSLSQPP